MNYPPSPPASKWKSTLFSHVLEYVAMFRLENYYILWTVSMCNTPSLHSKLCKIVVWYECTRIICMDYLDLKANHQSNHKTCQHLKSQN